MEIKKIAGRAVPVTGDAIDTDRIIPARFMKCVVFDKLGEAMFYDTRFDANGKPTAHPLNDPKFQGATILLSGDNFGCGSSREHAPQAIVRYGFRAIIAEGFAEIFFGNATTLGLPCVKLKKNDLRKLTELVLARPETEVSIDLESQTVSAVSLSFSCEMRASARDALISGSWDPLGQLMSARAETAALAARLPYVTSLPSARLA
jgi:3-isopropylmalate/(R)-2-methylmalate dehydratase small subunit